MTLEQYQDLNELEQTEVVWDKGVLVGERKEGNVTYRLYLMYDFYIEQKLDKYGLVMFSLQAYDFESLILDGYSITE